ncbi:putative aspartate aminotransferase [Azorhizobium caulinodans ORS 571]|uniref:Aminotransferase n=1 Tax=Azorhizobium caulinodans (strain ATCC 43989 / DSM 5975 / JCM 20966 / LMG 6465 / NBRC 14845 / NCIMB 13405 / ORS 571) TaxID=438753 RepID=A8IGJ5_AZOC5|nr:aminotransferase class I/II-fold pyridoxal phosphate-dependent enzyme [Azorhizobium caulinodans]BAF86095.1 putative aspartate aminotransferase [Azorhizobium caulinodans ORS 571]
MPDTMPTSATTPSDDRRSPFVRLADLLAGIEPGRPPLIAAVGEPQHAFADFVASALHDTLEGFGRYPRQEGTPEFRAAVAEWLGKRYTLARPVDPDREVLALNGSREGLVSATFIARRRGPERKGAPIVLVPNPLYAAYRAGAELAGCEVVPMPTTRESGWLPDLDALDPALLDRAVVLFLASPANPQGAVASREYLTRLMEMTRRHGVYLFADECYSEIYLEEEKPTGVLEVAEGNFSGILSFNSLSKRSSLPGLRVGFVAGDPVFLRDFLAFRGIACPQVPEPLQAVAVAALQDEAHVIASRMLYKSKFDIADRLLHKRFGYKRPDGGFFLWLDVSDAGGGEAAALRLWKEQGLRTVPGGYLASRDLTGHNPGEPYLRVAMVHDLTTSEEVLNRLIAGLS